MLKIACGFFTAVKESFRVVGFFHFLRFIKALNKHALALLLIPVKQTPNVQYCRKALKRTVFSQRTFQKSLFT